MDTDTTIIGGSIKIDIKELESVLNNIDLTLGCMRSSDFPSIVSKAQLLIYLRYLREKFSNLFNKDPEELNIPSLSNLERSILIQLYIHVKYLRSRDGFEREAEISSKNINIQQSYIKEEKPEQQIKNKILGVF